MAAMAKMPLCVGCEAAMLPTISSPHSHHKNIHLHRVRLSVLAGGTEPRRAHSTAHASDIISHVTLIFESSRYVDCIRSAYRELLSPAPLQYPLPFVLHHRFPSFFPSFRLSLFLPCNISLNLILYRYQHRVHASFSRCRYTIIARYWAGGIFDSFYLNFLPCFAWTGFDVVESWTGGWENVEGQMSRHN